MLFPRLLPLLFLVPLSSPVLSQDMKTQSVPKSCAVTRPSEHPFVPPSPYGANGVNWFGTDRLWTFLPSDGIWGQGEKTFWFREEWSRYHGWIPDKIAMKLTITARRLDAPTPPPEIWQGRRSIRIGRHSCSEASAFRHQDAGKLPGVTKMPKCSLSYGLYLTRPRNKRAPVVNRR